MLDVYVWLPTRQSRLLLLRLYHRKEHFTTRYDLTFSHFAQSDASRFRHRPVPSLSLAIHLRRHLGAM